MLSLLFLFTDHASSFSEVAVANEGDLILLSHVILVLLPERPTGKVRATDQTREAADLSAGCL